MFGSLLASEILYTTGATVAIFVAAGGDAAGESEGDVGEAGGETDHFCCRCCCYCCCREKRIWIGVEMRFDCCFLSLLS